MDLIIIVKMFENNQEQVLEKVCELLSILQIEDDDFKLELKFQMQCVIHKYAKTLDDIERLEGVIGLQEAITAREFQDRLLIDRGKFARALEIKKKLGISEATRISGFSIEELEKEELNK